jgi:hypothetical protein
VTWEPAEPAFPEASELGADLGAVGIAGLGLCRGHVEQTARPGDVVGARGAGEQAIATDALEALRQDVDEGSGG